MVHGGAASEANESVKTVLLGEVDGGFETERGFFPNTELNYFMQMKQHLVSVGSTLLWS